MHQTGLLIVTVPLRNLLGCVSNYLLQAKKLVHKRLYIKLEPGFGKVCRIKQRNVNDFKGLSKVIPAVYYKACECCADLDVRVLQAISKEHDVQDSYIKHCFDVIITDSVEGKSSIQHYLKQQFNKTCQNIIQLKEAADMPVEDIVVDDVNVPTYKTVVLGGTFDRLHSGHKVLLSEAVLRTAEKLIIGVTDGNMIQKKVLWELIEPVEERINQVADFLNDIDPTVKYDVVPIYDPFGPAVELPEIDCIVVSEETEKGGNKVNFERTKKGYKELEMYTVPLIEDPHKSSNIEETKVSSSSLRIRLLGKLLKHPEPKPHLPTKPYLIGLTGGIASGKSSIAMLMHSLGAEIISCDKLAHQTYECGTKTYNSIVHEFGKDVVSLNGTINHKTLGTKVFENESKRQWLNNLIWPEVETLVKKEVQRFAAQGAKIILLEVPLLIEAGWQNKVHQVWTTIITESEAVKRLKFRNGLSEEEAWKRIDSQISNVERIKYANVVFCTQWDPDYTKKQVERAWEQLQDFLKEEVESKY